MGKTTTAERLHQWIPDPQLYDPEEFGAFLWHCFPAPMKRNGDFQDLELWRSFTCSMLRHISQNYGGHILVPMTLVNPAYFDEIIGALRRDGSIVRHFILTASREVILSRLLGRGEEKNSWAEQQLDRCMKAFETCIDGERIDTTRQSAEAAARCILARIFCTPSAPLR